MKRVLDSSLEWLILLARVLSVACLVAFVTLLAVLTVAARWYPWAALALQAILWAGAFGWFGWWLYGNEEWRRRGEKAE